MWELANELGYRVGAIGVPPTYPPKPLKGVMITDFITLGLDKSYISPPTLKFELERKFGRYIFDVVYRSEDKDKIIRELF